MTQTRQHPENPPTTTRNPTDAERTLRPSSPSQGREDPESERKSSILSAEAVWCTKLKWLTGTVIEILERGRSYIIEGPNGKKYRRNRAHLKPLCHDGSSFQDPPKAKRQILTRRDNVDSFQDPRPKPREERYIRRRPIDLRGFKYLRPKPKQDI